MQVDRSKEIQEDLANKDNITLQANVLTPVEPAKGILQILQEEAAKPPEEYKVGNLTREMLEKAIKDIEENRIKPPIKMSRKKWKREKRYRKTPFQNWLANSFKNSKTNTNGRIQK